MFIASEKNVWSLLNKKDQAQYDGLSFAEAKAIIMTLKPEERFHWYGFKMGWYDWKPLKDCVELITFSRMSRSPLKYTPPPFPDMTGSNPITHSEMDPPTLSQADAPEEESSEGEYSPDTFCEYEGEPETKSDYKAPPKGFLGEISVVGADQDDEIVMDKPEEIKKMYSPLDAETEEEEEVLASTSDTLDPDFQDSPVEATKRESFDGMPVDMNTIERLRRYKRHDIKLHVELICNNQRFTSYTRDISLGGVAVEDTIPPWVAGYCTVIISTADLEHRLEFMCSVVENQSGEKTRLELYPSSDTGELKMWLENGPPDSHKTSA